MSEEHGKIE